MEKEVSINGCNKTKTTILLSESKEEHVFWNGGTVLDTRIRNTRLKTQSLDADEKYCPNS